MSIILDNYKSNAVIADQLVAHLRLQIVSGAYAEGERLSENILANQFGSSRGPVRAALKILENEGLVSLTKQGVVFHCVTDRDVDQLYNARYMLESYCLTHVGEEQITALTKRLDIIVDRMALALKHQDFEEFSRQDIEFHEYPFQLIDHKFIIQFWNNISGLFQSVLYIGTKKRFENGDFEMKAEVVEKHRDIVAAIRRNDPHEIDQALIEHFRRTCWFEKEVF